MGSQGAEHCPEKGCQGSPPHCSSPCLRSASPQSTLASPHLCQFLFLRLFFAFSPPSFSLPLSPVSLSSPPLPSPSLSFLLFSYVPQAFYKMERWEDQHPLLHSCRSICTRGPSDRAQAFGPSLRGSSWDHCLLQPPAGLGLLLGGLRASFPRRHSDRHFPGQPSIAGGTPHLPPPSAFALFLYPELEVYF